jgi:osmoprotectant transport system substrate-binding protein
MTIRRTLSAALTLAGLLLVTGCGEEGGGGGSAQPQGGALRITLGTQNFAEAFVLGELYRQALAANGYAVDLRKNIGPTEPVDQALRSGEIDGYTAYMGTSLSVVAREESSGLSAEETHRRVKAFYESRGQTVSSTTPFENVDAVATTQLFAQRHRLRTVADLRKLERFTFGAQPEYESRLQGLAGLQSVYGLTNAVFKPIALGAQYRALEEGDVDTADVFTTDPTLSRGDYVVLEDPERLFGSQHAGLVIDADKLERVGREKFLRVIDDVNRRLTTDVIVDMNTAVESGQDEADVAARFLREAGILRGG